VKKSQTENASQETPYDHHREYMKSVDAITAGAEKILKVCGDSDSGGLIPGHDEGPYVKLSLPMFALRLASNLYWHTSKPPAQRDEDDEDDEYCGNPNCPEHGDNRPKVARVRSMGMPPGMAQHIEELVAQGLTEVGEPVDVTGNVRAGDPLIDAVIHNMPVEERRKLMQKLQAMEKCPVDAEDSPPASPAPLPPE